MCLSRELKKLPYGYKFVHPVTPPSSIRRTMRPTFQITMVAHSPTRNSAFEAADFIFRMTREAFKCLYGSRVRY